MDERIDITPAEWRIMRIVWTLGDVTSSQIIELIQKKMDWKPATIKTLIRRLVDKGALKAEREGRAFRYSPLIDEQITMNEMSDQLFSSICQMHAGKTLAHVINQVNLSKSDIKALQKLLHERAKTAPDEVECDCLPKTMKISCE
ncbi:CopY/TcrY family copper transport repressor [Lactobacillaceae bacterium 24-114]